MASENYQAQIDELKERISTLENLLQVFLVTQDVLIGRFTFAREVIRRVHSIPPHISFTKEEIDNLLPKDGKAKDVFIEELKSFNERRHRS